MTKIQSLVYVDFYFCSFFFPSKLNIFIWKIPDIFDILHIPIIIFSVTLDFDNDVKGELPITTVNERKIVLGNSDFTADRHEEIYV